MPHGGRWAAVSPGLLLVLACVVALVAEAAPASGEPKPRVAEVPLRHGPVRYEFATPPGGCDGERGCPLVVLVAGYAVPMVLWDETVPALTQAGFAVLRFDLYGRGRSARPRARYTPKFFADQIWELVTAKPLAGLRLPRRFHVIASSMGGAVAAVFAGAHPDAVDRVVLVSPAGLSVEFPPVTTALKTPVLGRWYFSRWFRSIMAGHLQSEFYRDVHSYPKVLVEFQRQLEVAGTAEAMYSTLRLTILQDLSAEFRGLGGLHRPTLAVWGDEDHVVPLDTSRAVLRRAIPHLELWRIPRAAHLPPLEQPRAFNDLVTRFLRR